MRHFQYYRGWCPVKKQFIAWQEPTCRVVDKLLCPLCGGLHDAAKGGAYKLKGEAMCEARTFIERCK